MKPAWQSPSISQNLQNCSFPLPCLYDVTWVFVLAQMKPSNQALLFKEKQHWLRLSKTSSKCLDASCDLRRSKLLKDPQPVGGSLIRHGLNRMSLEAYGGQSEGTNYPPKIHHWQRGWVYGEEIWREREAVAWGDRRKLTAETHTEQPDSMGLLSRVFDGLTLTCSVTQKRIHGDYRISHDHAIEHELQYETLFMGELDENVPKWTIWWFWVLVPICGLIKG